MNDLFPKKIKFDKNGLIIDELLLLGYEINSAEPRLFSEFFTEKEPIFYNYTIEEAIMASFSHPGCMKKTIHTKLHRK